jgi:MscS family membrane protein
VEWLRQALERLELHPALVSLAILVLSYVAARLVSFVLGQFLARAAARTATSFDDRLLLALQRPVTYVLFLSGARIAVDWLPVTDRWAGRAQQALFVLTVLLVALLVARVYSVLLHWYASDSARMADGPAREFRPLFSKIGKLGIGLIALVTILQNLGVNVESLVLSLGVGSLAVGLAARDTLANMFAGFTIMLDRPFHLGDRIQLSTGEVGDVAAIGMRATRLVTPDDTVLVVPNSVLAQDRIVNRNRPTRHMTARLDVSVAYGTDLARARAVLIESALASNCVETERAPAAYVTQFADSSVHLRLVFWAKTHEEQSQALSNVHEEIYRRFAAEGIEIPFPVRRLVQSGAALAPAPEA